MNFLRYDLRNPEQITQVRFYAHDRIGDSQEGAVAVEVDGQLVAPYIDIKKDGAWHTIRVNMYARTIVIRPVTDDEVSVQEVYVETEYGGYPSQPDRFQGRCIGGDICGQYNTLRINLGGRFVEQVEFYADDNVGSSNEGRVDVRVNGRVIAYGIDIKQAGSLERLMVRERVYDLEFVPVTDDEVNIHYVDVFYGYGRPRR